MNLDSRQIADILHGMGKARYRSDSGTFFGALERCAELLADKFDAQNVVNTLWAYAMTKQHPGKGLTRALEGQAESIAGTFTAQDVANTLWAYASMGLEPGAGLMKVLEGQAETLANTLDVQNVTNMLWAYATMGRMPGEVLIGVLERSLGLALEALTKARSAQKFDPQDKLACRGAAAEAVGKGQASSVASSVQSRDAADQVIELVRAMLLHMRDTEGKEWLETSSLQQAAHMLQVSLSISRTGSLTHFPLARARANCLALSLARSLYILAYSFISSQFNFTVHCCRCSYVRARAHPFGKKTSSWRTHTCVGIFMHRHIHAFRAYAYVHITHMRCGEVEA